MNEAHAYLPPSSAAAWVQCAMWPTMNARYPELESTPESVEGVTCHWLISEVIPQGGMTPQVGMLAPTGVTVDEEMIEGLEQFEIAISKVRHQKLHVEERIHGKRVHETLNWGTPDLWTVSGSVDTHTLMLDVYDYKHGHEFVEVYENFQLINYTALIFEALGVGGGSDHLITVNLHVVQPRSYTPEGPHRTWTVKGDDLRGYFNILAGSALKATSPEPVATVGPACKHCPGRHACVTLERAAQGAADLAFHSLPVELTPQAVGIELRMLQRAAKMLDARITGLEEHATGMIRQGVLVPGYHMATTQGRENWGKPIEEVIALGAMLGIDVAKPGVITPAQARKKGLASEIVTLYMAPRGNALKLEPDDNTLARKVFG